MFLFLWRIMMSCQHVSAAFWGLGVKLRISNTETCVLKYCRCVLSWEQLPKHVKIIKKKKEIVHLHYAGAGFQMQVVLLTQESACYFWWMLLLSRWSGHGVRCDLVIRELRDWWKLFLEEQMQSGSLLGAAALLCIAPFKEKKPNKQPWRCFQNICLKGECWDAKKGLWVLAKISICHWYDTFSGKNRIWRWIWWSALGETCMHQGENTALKCRNSNSHVSVEYLCVFP